MPFYKVAAAWTSAQRSTPPWRARMHSSGTRNASPEPTSFTWGPASQRPAGSRTVGGQRSTRNFPSWGQGSARTRPGMQQGKNTCFCNVTNNYFTYIVPFLGNCHFLLLTPSSQTNLSRKRWKLTVWPLGAEFANRQALGLLKMQKGKTVWWNFLPIIRRQWALRIHPPLCCPTPFSPPFPWPKLGIQTSCGKEASCSEMLVMSNCVRMLLFKIEHEDEVLNIFPI